MKFLLFVCLLVAGCATFSSAEALPKRDPCPPKALSRVDAKLVLEAEASIRTLRGVAGAMQGNIDYYTALMLHERADDLQAAIDAAYVSYMRVSSYCACLKGHKLKHPAPACAVDVRTSVEDQE